MLTRENQLLTQIAEQYQTILGPSLTGIYIHGSLAFDCFHWDRSDLDFLVVTETEPSLSQKEALIRVLLRLTPDAPPKGFEMSVVLKENCRHFTHPTPYVLHFSNAYLAQCQMNLTEYCQTMHGLDPDLAAHFTVLRAVGYPLCGQPVSAVFAPVPPEAYWDSLWYDTQDAPGSVEDNPVYVILNLCRVLAYAQEGLILSKEQGGHWGLTHLPQYQALLQKALDCYINGASAQFDTAVTQPFVRHMLSQIQKAAPNRQP